MFTMPGGAAVLRWYDGGLRKFAGLMLGMAGLVPTLQAAAPHSLDLERRVTGTVYVAADIPGYGAVQLLVDTGSSYFVIGEAMRAQLERAGAAHYSRELSGLMADGSRQTVALYRIAELRLGENCRLRDVEAAVFPSNLRPILGMNVLERLAPFTLSLDPPSLQFNACTHAAPAELVTAPDASPSSEAKGAAD